MGVYGDWLTAGASLRWALEELEFVGLPGLHQFWAAEVAIERFEIVE